MKLSTFIKSYKIALSSVCEKVSDWKSLYLASVMFPDSDDNITFIFSNSDSMASGSLGVSATLSESSIESISGGLDSISLIEEAPDVKINDAGKFLVILNNLINHLMKLFSDKWVDIEVSHLWFDYDKGLAYFKLDKFESVVQTDGKLFLFGGRLDE